MISFPDPLKIFLTDCIICRGYQPSTSSLVSSECWVTQNSYTQIFDIGAMLGGFPDVMISNLLTTLRRSSHYKATFTTLHGPLPSQAGWTNILILNSFLLHQSKTATSVWSTSITTSQANHVNQAVSVAWVGVGVPPAAPSAPWEASFSSRVRAWVRSGRTLLKKSALTLRAAR